MSTFRLPSPSRLTLIALALGLAACSKLTLANYDRVKVGMPYDEVVTLIGEPARCNETLGLRACHWGTEEQGATITFAGGKVMVSSAKNLK